jgi:hypothetical protein
VNQVQIHNVASIGVILIYCRFLEHGSYVFGHTTQSYSIPLAGNSNLWLRFVGVLRRKNKINEFHI